MSERNPDLPILDELGAEFGAMASAAYAAEGEGIRAAVAPADLGAADRSASERHTVRRRAPLPASRGTRERGAQARRIGRRAAIVLVLICLVGGVAFAAFHGGGGSGGHAHTSPALLGRDPGGAWSFSVYRDKGRLCTVFVPRGGELSGNCGTAPGRGRVRAASAIAASRRYVFGVGGAGVDRVSASLGEAGAATGNGPSPAATHGGAPAARAEVRAPGDRNAANDAGLPRGDGWFVVDLGAVHRVAQPGAPAVVVPLTPHGQRAGPPYVDCSLGVIATGCRRRIESAARG